MKQVPALQLNIIKDTGEEIYIHQNYDTRKNNLLWSRPNLDYTMYKRPTEMHQWERVYPANHRYARFRDNWYEDMTAAYGLGGTMTIPGGLNIIQTTTTNATIPRRQGTTLTTTAVDPVARTVTFGNPANEIPLTLDTEPGWGWEDAWIDEEPIREFVTHEEHTRIHQEMLEAQRRAAEMLGREARRREEQRIAQQERDEAERNRPRRPWDRVRNFFGRE